MPPRLPDSTSRPTSPLPAIAGGLTAFAVTGLLAAAALRTPPDDTVALVLLGLAATLAFCLATAQFIAALRTTRLRVAAPDSPEASAADLRRRELAVEERTHRLEIREQRLARRLRVHQFLEHEHLVDVVDSEMSPHAVERLVQADSELLALIERRSRHAFDDILTNRYAGPDGVDMPLVMRDLGEFIESVARLYQPDARDPLLETQIELIAKATSSAALHLLVVVEDLPINLKTYNAASLYRLLRRAADYFGTYRNVKPYLDVGLNALQVARFALGANPVALGATWVAGKLAARGAQKATEEFLHREALQLLHDTIRVIAFEVALVYGQGFRRRDANWFLGAELVNLEVLRGDDRRGRDAALAILTSLALRHEFDRLLLLRHLGSRRPVDVDSASIEALLTPAERQRILDTLMAHVEHTGVDLADDRLRGWREAVEARLKVATEPVPSSGAQQRRAFRPPSPQDLLDRLRRWRRRDRR